jgi:hypothetical protein
MRDRAAQEGDLAHAEPPDVRDELSRPPKEPGILPAPHGGTDSSGPEGRLATGGGALDGETRVVVGQSRWKGSPFTEGALCSKGSTAWEQVLDQLALVAAEVPACQLSASVGDAAGMGGTRTGTAVA